jgi:hypothetical protein
LTIAGQTYSVSQAALSCSVNVTPTSVDAVGAGRASTVSVTTTAVTCSWTATTAANWITLSPSTGTGNGSVRYSLERNQTGDTRTATITVGSKAIKVTQDSVARPSRPTGLKVHRK